MGLAHTAEFPRKSFLTLRWYLQDKGPKSFVIKVSSPPWYTTFILIFPNSLVKLREASRSWSRTCERSWSQELPVVYGCVHCSLMS